MGMYDTFGDSGDQLKIFGIPIYYFNQSVYDKFKETGQEYHFLGYSGGSLNNFSIGDDVPWRAMSYNYSPEFTVLDIGWEDFEDFSEWPTMLYSFDDGKLTRVIEYNKNDLNSYSGLFYKGRVVINRYGSPIKIDDIYMLQDYMEAYREERKNRFVVLDKTSFITNALFDYAKITKDDKDKYKIFTEALENVNKITDELLEKNYKKLDCYQIKTDTQKYKIDDYGAYLELVQRISDKNYTSSFNDKEEVLAALLHEAKKYVEDNHLKLNDFFKWNQTPEEDKPWIRVMDKKIKEG